VGPRQKLRAALMERCTAPVLRVTVIERIQRNRIPTSFVRLLATRFGGNADE